jgi:hypothetical protein
MVQGKRWKLSFRIVNIQRDLNSDPPPFEWGRSFTVTIMKNVKLRISSMNRIDYIKNVIIRHLFNDAVSVA